MKIAIIGATSQIAKDLIFSFPINTKDSFSLFCRNPELLFSWAQNKKLGLQYLIEPYTEFNFHRDFDVVINFVGAGDPARTQKMGSDIIKITEHYDNMALEYLKNNKHTKYIFLSSGAVYGGNYQEPITENTAAIIDINNLKITDSYTIAKMYAEAKHRLMFDFSIIDVRVFNYFSHTQDLSSRFLITDIVRAIKNKKVFKTSKDNIYRDFISPLDFYNLIQAIIDFKSINTALDCYTKSPISKFDLLSQLKSNFGLKYEIEKSDSLINATGSKTFYYSTNKAARKLGYIPSRSSLESVISELGLCLIDNQ